MDNNSIEQLLNVVEAGLEKGTQKGAYSLKEASILNEVLNLLKNKLVKKEEELNE